MFVPNGPVNNIPALIQMMLWLGADQMPSHFLNQYINPLRAKFFQREHKHIFTFCVISPH